MRWNFSAWPENLRGKLIRSQSLAEVVLRERNAEPARAFCYFTYWMLLHGLACWLVGGAFLAGGGVALRRAGVHRRLPGHVLR